MNVQCSCINGKFDFTICHNDCSKIVYSDLSDWMEEEYYTLPETYPATVTHPLGNTTTINFKPKQSTVFTAKEFTGIDSNIPDGIYCITVENCGITYTKSFAILCDQRSRMNELYLEEGNEEDLVRLERYHKYIEANAMFGNKDIAKSYFDISKKILDRISCTNC